MNSSLLTDLQEDVLVYGSEEDRVKVGRIVYVIKMSADFGHKFRLSCVKMTRK